MGKNYHQDKRDAQTPHSGKVENDSNKLGKERATQKNEGRRTPVSRHEREDKIGGKANVKLVRTGMAGQGEKGGPRSRTGSKP